MKAPAGAQDQGVAVWQWVSVSAVTYEESSVAYTTSASDVEPVLLLNRLPQLRWRQQWQMGLCCTFNCRWYRSSVHTRIPQFRVWGLKDRM